MSSLSGVVTSLALGLLRTSYEAGLDAHFDALEAELNAAMRVVFFRDWRPPSSRLVETVHSLNVVAKAMQGLSQQINDATTEILNKAVIAITERLEPVPAGLTNAIEKGLSEGTVRIVESLQRETERIAEENRARSERVSIEIAGEFAEARRVLADAMTTFRQQQSDFSSRVGAAATSFDTAGQAMTAAAAGLDGTSKAVSDVLAEVGGSLQELAIKVSERLGGAVGEVDDHAARLRSSVETVGVTIEELREVMARDINRVDENGKAAVEQLKALAEATAEHARFWRESVAKEVPRLSQSIGALVEGASALSELRTDFRMVTDELAKIRSLDAKEIEAHERVLDRLTQTVTQLAGPVL